MARVTEKSHNELRRKYDDARQQLKDAQQACNDKQELIERYDDDLKELEVTKTELQVVAKANKDLEHQNSVLRAQLEAALKALKDSGKHARWEESSAVKKEINKWIKEVGYRETKFAKDSALEDFVRSVYDGIKERLSLDDSTSACYVAPDEFVRIYLAHVNAQLSVRRQYTQSMCLKAVTRTYQ